MQSYIHFNTFIITKIWRQIEQIEFNNKNWIKMDVC